MKTFLLRLRLSWRALATCRPVYWLRLVWRAKSLRARDTAVAEYGREWVNAFDDAVKQLDALPTPVVPLVYERPRRLSRDFCANHCGLGFVAPNATPNEGFFWKRDREGLAWRLYRERI